MKNIFKVLCIAAFVLATGFFMAGCELFGSNSVSIDGVWERGDDIVITISGNQGVFTEIKSGGWKTVMDNGNVKLGDQKLRNITKTEDLKWTAQDLTFGTSSFTTSFSNCTITLSSDHKTLTVVTSGITSPSIYTKR